MPQQLSEPEDVIRALRPDLPADPVWADAALSRVLATPRPSSHRRRWVVGGVALAAFAVGGGAYAGGLVPSVVAERLGSGDQEHAIHRIGEVREVFALTTEDGSVVRLFAAPNDAGGECWTQPVDLAPDADPEDLAFGCAAGPDGAIAGTSADGVGLLAVDSENPAGPILFGHATGGFVLPAGTVEVRITGPGVERTLPVAGAEGWATLLPIHRVAGSYVVEFRDSAGRVLHTARQDVDASSMPGDASSRQ